MAGWRAHSRCKERATVTKFTIETIGCDLVDKQSELCILLTSGLVKSFGERLSSCTAESFHRKARAQISEALKPALEPLFSVLARLDEEIAAYVEQLAKKYPDVEVIAQPKGVGVLTALLFLLTLEDKT
jgi:hypothetical protein